MMNCEQFRFFSSVINTCRCIFVYSYSLCKCFEPRSISSLLRMIVRVSVVLKRTVVVDID